MPDDDYEIIQKYEPKDCDTAIYYDQEEHNM